MKYEQWRTNPRRFLAMTGYTFEQFDKLLADFIEMHNEYLSSYYITGKPRKHYRTFVIYANSPLPTIEERLVFILSYLKLNPLQEQHADTFSMDQKPCNEFIHGLKIILDKTLEASGDMPAQTQLGLSAKLEAFFPEGGPEKEILHDGSEREIPRPLDQDEQQEKYSGKKKKHTVKNGIITTVFCLVLFVSPTVNGSVHDKKIADTYYSIPKKYKLWQDTGYQGYRPDGVTIEQPHKKPKGKELTKEQKDYNRMVSSFRVRVEHAIGSVKRLRIVKDECRLRKAGFVESIFATCAALHNLRIRLMPFSYKNKLT